METTKVITQEEYDKLPGTGAVAILNGIGKDGQPILKYGKCKFKNGNVGIVKYWVDENGERCKIAGKFIVGKQY